MIKFTSFSYSQASTGALELSFAVHAKSFLIWNMLAVCYEAGGCVKFHHNAQK